MKQLEQNIFGCFTPHTFIEHDNCWKLNRGYLIFFGVRSIFISSNEHPKLYFHEWRVKIPLWVFMSEIKINLTRKKINFLFLSCFYVEKNNLFQSVSRHHRKLTFFLVITRQLYDVQRIYCI